MTITIEKRRPARLAAECLLALMTGLALTMDMSLPAFDGNGMGPKIRIFREICRNLRISAAGTFLPAILIALAVLFLSLFLPGRGKDHPLPVLIDLFLAFFWLLSRSFSIDDSLRAVGGSWGQAVKSCIYTIGIFHLLRLARRSLSLFLDRSERERAAGRGKGLRHPFLVSFLAMLAAWTPHLILSFPAAMCYDTWIQIGMYLGRYPFIAHHPPFHTWLTGFVVQAAHLLTGTGNWGLFLLALFQTLLGALALSAAFRLMADLSAPRWLFATALLGCCFLPYYTGYQALVIKDMPYTAFFVLFVVQTARILISTQEEDYFSGFAGVFFLAVSILGTWLFRNNGRYILYVMVPILFLVCLVRYLKRKRPGLALKAFLSLVLPMVLAFGIEAGILRLYHGQKGSVGEALSLPFQQTARYLKTWPEDVTKEEAEIIDAVLDYAHLAEYYDPRISDPVKVTYKKEAGREALLAYLGVWRDQFFRHPLVYFEATLNQNYYLLYPLVENDTLYTDTIDEGVDFEVEYAGALAVTEVPRIKGLDGARREALRLLFTLPLTGLFSSLAFYNLLLILLFERMIGRRDPAGLLVMLPLLLSDGIILLAPVIQGHPRYGFPVIYAFPLLLAFALRPRGEKALDKDG